MYAINQNRIVQSLLLMFGLMLFSGCTPPQQVKKKPIKSGLSKPTPKPAKVTTQEKKPVTDVIILLSSEADAYKNIAGHLQQSIKQGVEVHRMNGSKFKDVELIKYIQASDKQQLVAVGLPAALAAKKLIDKNVIFCQVFNHRDHRLVSNAMKGVSAMPSAKQLFETWKALSPKIERVLLVSGKNLEHYIARVRKAAAKYNIELVHKVVRTDKEYLYAVKNASPKIQGHWIIPDNRVLSFKVIKEVMAFNSKTAKQTVVFQPQLLSFGGLFYIEPSEKEISQLIFQRLSESINDQLNSADDMIHAGSNTLAINPTMAKQLGITIPDKYQRFIQ